MSKTNDFDELIKTEVELGANSILSGGYGLVAQEVMRNKNIKPQSKAIYSYLCSLAGSKGVAYPSKELMCEELGMNKNTFEKYLKELLSLGYVKVTQSRRNGKMYKNIYTIAMDKRDFEANRKLYAQISINNKNKRPLKQVNNLPSPCHKNCDIELQCHKKQGTEICDSNINSLKNNRFVVVNDAFATNENKIIDLYKTFKLEKRVTPHMLKLLKQYVNKFDIEIFEDIFINTAEKKPDSNFRYIRHILQCLEKKEIFTIAQYKLDLENYKISKNSKSKFSKNTVKKIEKENRCESKDIYKKTAFHNFNETFTDYSECELDEIIEKSQKEKFGNENEHKKRAHA